jgi:hypothetical protein
MHRKKILIISYYYPPSNCVAALRPHSFADYLSDFYDIKVITRQWDGNEKQWEDYLKSNLNEQNTVKQKENLEITYVPYKDARKKKNKLRTILSSIIGKLDFDYDCDQLKPAAFELIEKWKPNLVLVSLPPNNLINLAYSINKKYTIPFIVDFRDFENEVLLYNQPVSLKTRTIHYFTTKTVLRKTKKSTLITSINKVFSDFFIQNGMDNTKVIYNGFEKKIFNTFNQNLKNSTFNVSIIGTLYPQQNIEIMLDGIVLFNQKKYNNVIFNFIGTDSILEIGERIKDKLSNFNNINLTKRLERKKALEITATSHILWHVGWKNAKGVFSGKIFEYLGAKRNILIAPSDEDVMEALLKETNAGETANSPEDVCAYLEKKYLEWAKKGFIDYNGIDSKIAFYSRENQARMLQKEIEKILI